MVPANDIVEKNQRKVVFYFVYERGKDFETIKSFPEGMVSEPNGGSVLQFVYFRIDNADAVEESKSDCDIYLANGGIEE